MKASAEICKAERSILLAEALRASGQVRLQVFGESMLPALWPGDLIEVERCPISEIRRGDIVLALRDGRLYLHRFLRRGADGGFVLRGDSMPKSDPAFAAEAFLGRLVSPGRSSGSLPWSARVLGLIFCYCGIARRLALRWHRGRSAENFDSLVAASRGEA